MSQSHSILAGSLLCKPFVLCIQVKVFPHSTLSILNISPLIPQKASDLVDMINRVIREGLEGLVLKDAKVRWSQALPSVHGALPAEPFQPWPGDGSGGLRWWGGC